MNNSVDAEEFFYLQRLQVTYNQLTWTFLEALYAITYVYSWCRQGHLGQRKDYGYNFQKLINNEN